jgi:predicted GNAT family acetyltransferase
VAVTVRDNPELNRYEIHEDGQLVGFSEYKLSDGAISFLHTEVDPAFGGRGLGRQLVEVELDDARNRGLSVLPFCPYVRKVVADNPEYLALVPCSERSRFDLPTDD